MNFKKKKRTLICHKREAIFCYMFIEIKIKVYKKEIGKGKETEEKEYILASLLLILSFIYIIQVAQYKLNKQFYTSKRPPMPISRILISSYQVDKFLW